MNNVLPHEAVESKTLNEIATELEKFCQADMEWLNQTAARKRIKVERAVVKALEPKNCLTLGELHDFNQVIKAEPRDLVQVLLKTAKVVKGALDMEEKHWIHAEELLKEAIAKSGFPVPLLLQAILSLHGVDEEGQREGVAGAILRHYGWLKTKEPFPHKEEQGDGG